MNGHSRARKATLGVTGPKAERTSLGVTLAVPRSPKPTFKKNGGAGRHQILRE
jgi:hypothetical protein